MRAASMRAATTRRPNTAVGSVCTGYAIGPFYPICVIGPADGDR